MVIEREGMGASPDRAPDRGPDAGPDGRPTVAVIGSCMTRDVFNRRFNPRYDAWFRVAFDQMQPSLISLMSRPTSVATDAFDSLGAFEGRRLSDDVSKAILGRIEATPPDYLVVDFSGDVRFGAIRLDEDRWITNCRKVLRRTAWYRELEAASPLTVVRMQHEPDAYVELFAAALDRFAAHVRRVAPGTKVVLHRGHYVRRLILPRSGRLVPLNEHRQVVRTDQARMDARWARLDDLAIDAHGWSAIDLRGREYPTSDSHPWGAGHLHYSPDYYPDVLAALAAIHLERAGAPLGPESAAMAAFIAGRASDPGRGRPWDAEPGRGDWTPRVRTPPRFGPVRRPLRRVTRRLRTALGGSAAPNRPGA